MRRCWWFIKSPEFDTASASCVISLETHKRRNDLKKCLQISEGKETRSGHTWGKVHNTVLLRQLLYFNEMLETSLSHGVVQELWRAGHRFYRVIVYRIRIKSWVRVWNNWITYNFRLETDRRDRPEGSRQSSSCMRLSLSLWIF